MKIPEYIKITEVFLSLFLLAYCMFSASANMNIYLIKYHKLALLKYEVSLNES